MAIPRSFLLRLLGLSLLASGVACTALTTDDNGDQSADALEAVFDKNNVITDAELTAVDAMSVARVQAFLEKTPYGTRSALAGHQEGGKTAAQILHESAVKFRINPLVLLARVQLEQGLIAKTAASAYTLDIAFGCGCPDSPVCGPKYLGFTNQATCAANSLRKNLDRQKDGGSTLSGWKVDQAKKTQDAIEIVPKNAATAALYTYTPWVGESGGGKAGVGGTSLYFRVLKRFADALANQVKADAGPAPSPSGRDGASEAAPPKPPPPPPPVKDAGPCGCTHPDFPICDTAGGNQCVQCLLDSQCGGGKVCDGVLKKCVECTTGKTQNCGASGLACLANRTCGCLTDVDCGASDSGRVCNASNARCQEGCRGSGGNRCRGNGVCTSSGSAIGTCQGSPPIDAGSPDAAPLPDAAPPPPDAAPPVDPPPVDPPAPDDPWLDPGEDTDPDGHSTPSTNTAPPPQRRTTGLPSDNDEGWGSGPDPSLGKRPAASGCTTSPAAPSQGSGLALAAFGALVLASSRRRKP